MDFLDNVKKIVTDTAQTAVKKSGEIIESTKIKYNIFDLKNDIDKIYREIGEEIYNKFENEADVFDSVTQKCELIKEKNKMIAQLEKEIAELKNFVKCENCYSDCERTMKYCPKCGCILHSSNDGDNDKAFDAEVID